MNHEKIAALMKDALSFEINTNFLSVSNFRRETLKLFLFFETWFSFPSSPHSQFPYTFLSNFQNFINLLLKVRQTKSFQLIMGFFR